MPTITDLATANDDFTILAGLVLLNDSNNPGSTLLETLSDPLANVGLYAPTDNAFLDLAVSFGYVGDLSDDTAIAISSITSCPRSAIRTHCWRPS